MNLKLLEMLRNFNLEETTIIYLIEKTFQYFLHNKLMSLSDLDTEEKKKVFSILFRFFKSFSFNKILNEEQVKTSLKDVFKNKKSLSL